MCSNSVLETHCQTNNNVLSKILVLDHVCVVILCVYYLVVCFSCVQVFACVVFFCNFIQCGDQVMLVYYSVYPSGWPASYLVCIS